MLGQLDNEHSPGEMDQPGTITTHLPHISFRNLLKLWPHQVLLPHSHATRTILYYELFPCFKGNVLLLVTCTMWSPWCQIVSWLHLWRDVDNEKKASLPVQEIEWLFNASSGRDCACVQETVQIVPNLGSITKLETVSIWKCIKFEDTQMRSPSTIWSWSCHEAWIKLTTIWSWHP